MKFIDGYKRVIAIKECSCGNESVGSMWLETKSFTPETPLRAIVEWAQEHHICDGKLCLTIDGERSDENNNL